MLNIDDIRKVELLTYQDSDTPKWVEVQLSQLSPGDVFRMFEPDGTPVTRNNDGVTTNFMAMKAATIEIAP